MHKTPQSPEHPSLHEKKTHFYKQAKEALPFCILKKIVYLEDSRIP